jgi:5-oxoprolinase (ATP-hydrolysing)
MPAGAESLSDEGVVISPCYLFRGGRSCMNEIATQLSSGVFPSRQIDQNLADISAQVASLRQGLEQMKSLEERYSHGVLEKQMEALRIDASKNCGAFLGTYGNCKLNSIQYLDDGDILKLQISIKDGYSEFDFSGTSQSREDNLNATEAITLSAVCYCLRVLIGKELPLNEGLLEPISLIIPPGSILSPDFSGKAQDCPGVAGGNVEISQKVVDLILNAFQQVACSQGTMNNISFGNQSFSHYETIGGGSGAMIGQNGTSAVQVHMTNTAITDPEILESSFPLRLLACKVRDSSGGSGTWSGGNGIEREYLFEEKATLSLLTQNRKTAPLGIGGGNPGQPGEQILVRQNGKHETLSSIESVIVCPGDRLILRTPGGGGVGDPELLA